MKQHYLDDEIAGPIRGKSLFGEQLAPGEQFRQSTDLSFACDGLIGRLRGIFLRLFAVTDDDRTNNNEHHADPADGRDIFIQKPDGGKGRKNETQSGQRPDETDVAPGHHDQQADKEQRFKKNTRENLRAGRAGLDDAKNFRRARHFHFADVRHSFFQENDSGGFKDESDE
jgi:hypothetical protein